MHARVSAPPAEPPDPKLQGVSQSSTTGSLGPSPGRFAPQGNSCGGLRLAWKQQAKPDFKTWPWMAARHRSHRPRPLTTVFWGARGGRHQGASTCCKVDLK